LQFLKVIYLAGMTDQMLANILDQMGQMQVSLNEMKQIPSSIQGLKDKMRSLSDAVQNDIQSLGNRDDNRIERGKVFY
jgi:ABC-type hemin transport system substrate-binding protein